MSLLRVRSMAVRLLILLVILGYTVTARADITIETVPVGNVNNPSDTTGYGAVGYAYQMGKYEVTAGQYTAFLNAVAATDTYGLYLTVMYTSATGCKIRRLGDTGAYSYLVDNNGDGLEDADWVNRPVNRVSWGSAVRFANWMHNKQPTGAQGVGTTESGSYNVNGAISNEELLAVTRQPGATWVLPTENEWYKAAYHKNDGVTGNYWDYPTRTDATPNNTLVDPDPGNNVTFYWGGYTIGSPYYRTEVGAHENSDSPYGTFDQGGNVWEWNETVVGSQRGGRGGSWYSGYSLLASTRDSNPPVNDGDVMGFRVASVPEPGSIALLLAGGVALLVYRWRRRVISRRDVEL